MDPALFNEPRYMSRVKLWVQHNQGGRDRRRCGGSGEWYQEESEDIWWADEEHVSAQLQRNA